jgi:hypothetical protein
MSDGERTKIALACQGGGTHTAYTAGVLAELAPAIFPPVRGRPERTSRVATLSALPTTRVTSNTGSHSPTRAALPGVRRVQYYSGTAY